MKSRLALIPIAAALLLSSSAPSLGAQATIPPYVGTAVADMNRPQANKDVDAARHPEAMMAFSGAMPGSKVVEFVPGGGYVTRLFSKVVGPTGKVYPIQLPAFPDRMREGVNAVTGNPAYSNVSVLVQDPTALKIPEPVDVVWISENYHDFKNNGPFKTDTAAMDKSVFAALKPGGLYVITDYEAAPGSGVRDTQTLHRIDPAVIKSEVTAAGFTFEGESNALKNPDDKLTERSRQGASQVFYKFRKPR